MTALVSTSGRDLAERLHEPCASQPHLRGTGRDPATSTRPTRRGHQNETKHKNAGEAEQRSTIRPDVSVQLAEAAAAKGIRAVDAPVSGGEAGAVEGTLSIMVGGAVAEFEAARPVLEAVGSTIVHVGPSGSGQTVKAANQLIVAGTIELVAEAIVFLEAHGVDTSAAVRVLAGGLAGNRILDRKAPGMLARKFEPGFRVDLHHKDLGIVTAAAREAGVAIPLGSAVAQLMGSLRQQGHGSLDHSALLLQVEQLSGRAPRGEP